MPISVRAGALADCELLVHFNAAMARETEGRELDRAGLGAGIHAVLSGGPDGERGFYRVAVDGDRPVGALLVTREWSDWRNAWFWWIQSVYVEPAARRRGVLAALYRAVEAEALERGVCGLRLYVEAANTGAQAAYRRLGMEDSSYRMMEVALETAVEPNGVPHRP